MRIFCIGNRDLYSSWWVPISYIPTITGLPPKGGSRVPWWHIWSEKGVYHFPLSTSLNEGDKQKYVMSILRYRPYLSPTLLHQSHICSGWFGRWSLPLVSPRTMKLRMSKRLIFIFSGIGGRSETFPRLSRNITFPHREEFQKELNSEDE